MKRILLIALLLACLVGCGRSPAPPAPSRATRQQFKIGSANFGIDPTTSSFAVDTTDPDRPTITIKINGDQATFKDLTADEDSEWSWALDPPAFYLDSFPAQVDPSTGIATARVKLDDIDDYEFAIYMMEHNDIDDVTVQLIPDKSLEVSGRVDLFGEAHDFAIHWQR